MDTRSAVVSAAATGRTACLDDMTGCHVRRVITDNNRETNRRQPRRVDGGQGIGQRTGRRSYDAPCPSVIDLLVDGSSPGFHVHLLYIKRRWASLPRHSWRVASTRKCQSIMYAQLASRGRNNYIRNQRMYARLIDSTLHHALSFMRSLRRYTWLHSP